MICIETVKRFCTNYFEIENYDEAIKSKTMWHCHHRKEIQNGKLISKQDLIDNGLYYNVAPTDLIFLTSEEHRKLHGKYIRQETRDKLSSANKGRKVCFSDTWKRKISEARKRRVRNIELGTIYNSVKEAEILFSPTHSANGSISNSITKGYKAFGYHWEYV